jgi:hypothetical protein
MKFFISYFVMLAFCGTQGVPSATAGSEPGEIHFPRDAHLVLSTDLSGDVDDAAALGFLFEAAQRGRGRLAAVVTDSPAESAAPAARALLNAWGFSDVPVGAYQGEKGDSRDGPYARGVADSFGQAGRTRRDFPSDVEVLRQVYEAAPDRSIVFIAIGFLNSLEGLMRSPASDDADSLDGLALFERKTAYVVAVGANHLGNPDGETRWNWKHAPDAAAYVINHMPRPFFWLPANEVDQAGFPAEHPRFRAPHALTGPEGLGWEAGTNPIQLAFELTREHAPGLLAEGLRRKAFDPAAVRFATDLDTELLGFRHHGIHVEMTAGRLRLDLQRVGPFSILEWILPTTGGRSRDYLDAILARLQSPKR